HPRRGLSMPARGRGPAASAARRSAAATARSTTTTTTAAALSASADTIAAAPARDTEAPCGEMRKTEKAYKKAQMRGSPRRQGVGRTLGDSTGFAEGAAEHMCATMIPGHAGRPSAGIRQGGGLE